MFDLTHLDQVLNRARHVFNRNVGINPVLVIQVDGVNPQSLEGALDSLLDVLRSGIQPAPPGFVLGPGRPTELRCDHHSAPEGSEGLADQFLVRVWTVNFGRIEKRDAPLHGGSQQRDHRVPVRNRAVGPTHPHATETESRHFKGALPQLTFLHTQYRSQVTRQCSSARVDLMIS